MPRPRLLLAITLAVVVGVLPVTACGVFNKDIDVLLIGDSIMNQSGDTVLAQLRKDPQLDDVKVRKEAVNGSGLLTPSVYDWMGKADELVKEYKPKLVVILFIGNYSDTDLYVAGDGHQIPNTYQQDFYDEWAIQAGKLTKLLENQGARVDWVLPPPLKGDEGVRRETLMRNAYVELARQQPGVGLIDGRQALGDASGQFTWKLPDVTGHEQVVRQADTVHLTDAGGQLMARQIAFAITPTLVEIKRQKANA